MLICTALMLFFQWEVTASETDLITGSTPVQAEYIPELNGEGNFVDRKVYLSLFSPGYDCPLIALTFDDGPDPVVTDKILDILDRYRVRATFFVVGSSVKYFPGPMVRAYKAGHEIGNHTYNHRYLTRLSAQSAKNEIEQTNRLICSLTGHIPLYMRPPYGVYNRLITELIDFPFVLWSLDPKDWLFRDKNIIVENVLKNIKDGSVVILHDLYLSTAEALELLIPELIRRGYMPVTISELYLYKGLSPQCHRVYYGW